MKVYHSRVISSLSGKLNSTILMMRHVSQFLDQRTMVDIYYTLFYSHIIYGIKSYGHTAQRN